MLVLNSLQHDSQDTAIYDFYDNMTSREDVSSPVTSRELASDVTWARQWSHVSSPVTSRDKFWREEEIYYRLVSSTLEAVGVPMLVVSQSHVVHVARFTGELSYIALETPDSFYFNIIISIIMYYIVPNGNERKW